MKQLRRAAALLCAACLLLSLFGCRKSEGTPAEDDVTYDLIGVRGGDTALTVDGEAVDAETFCYWIYTSILNLSEEQFDGGEVDWTAEVDGQSVKDYVLFDAANIAVLYRTVEDHAVSLGCTRGEADETELSDLRAQYVASVGSEEGYLEQLRLVGLREETFMHFNRVTQYYNKLLDVLYLNDGAAYAPTDEQMKTYADETFQAMGYQDFNDYVKKNAVYNAKHILLLTKDMTTGEVYDDEKIAAQKALADDLLAQLRASDDAVALFDTLMNEYSEDPGLKSNPDGYLYSSGSMVAEFEDAVEALDDYEISEIVKSDYGYHIIMRLPITPAELREDYCQESLAALADEWCAAAKVEHGAAYDGIDPETYYKALWPPASGRGRSRVAFSLPGVCLPAPEAASPSPSAAS